MPPALCEVRRQGHLVGVIVEDDAGWAIYKLADPYAVLLKNEPRPWSTETCIEAVFGPDAL